MIVYLSAVEADAVSSGILMR